MNSLSFDWVRLAPTVYVSFPRKTLFPVFSSSRFCQFSAGSVRSQISAPSPMDLVWALGRMVFVWALKKIWCIVSFLKVIYRSLLPQNWFFSRCYICTLLSVQKLIRFKNLLISYMLPFSGQTVVNHQWTNEEKRAVLDHLGRFISSGVVPGKGPCEECIKRSQGALSSRSWTAVKFFVKNEVERRKRRVKK